MSEHRNVEMSSGAFFCLMLLLIATFVAFLGVGSQLRDAQRRIAVLEQQINQR